MFFSIFIELGKHHHNQFQNIIPQRNAISIRSHFPFYVVGWIVFPKRYVQVLTPDME